MQGVVQLGAGDGTGQQHRLPRLLQQVLQPGHRTGRHQFAIHQFVDQADLQRLFGRYQRAGGQQHAGAVRAHGTAQQALDAFRCDQADLHFVQADGIRARRIGTACHHPVVAAQGQHAAARRCMAGDRRNHRDAALGQRAYRAEERVPGVQQLVLVIAVREQVRHVHAAGEDALAAGQHDAVRVFGHRQFDGMDQLPAQLGVQCIDRRPRQPQLADGAMVDHLDERRHAAGLVAKKEPGR